MSSIFISYNRHSETLVRSLVSDVEALGHTVWFDQDLSGGQAWWDQILERIRSCEIFAFALSSEALESAACTREYQYAADLGKPILPVLVDDEVSTRVLPPALSKVQFVDYRKPDRDSALRLARATSSMAPAGPLPDPLPDPPQIPLSYLGRIHERIGTSSVLEFEEQSVLLVDLKRGLRDPETNREARDLLNRLKRRPDLLATVLVEIEEIGITQETPPSSEPRRSAQDDESKGLSATITDPVAVLLGHSVRPQVMTWLIISLILMVWTSVTGWGGLHLAAWMVGALVIGAAVPGGERPWWLGARWAALLGAALSVVVLSTTDPREVAYHLEVWDLTENVLEPLLIFVAMGALLSTISHSARRMVPRR